MRLLLVTGGTGFIGSNFILGWFRAVHEPVVNLDLLTYAGNAQNLSALLGNPAYFFVRGSIGDSALVCQLLQEYKPRAVVNFAAESHVDRSIYGPEDFVQTNIVGTFRLLEQVRAYWLALPSALQQQFRFLQVSTDEVYGSLDTDASPFTEMTAYAPNSPYAASKASADHLVRAYFHTYGLPVLTTNCSNNYGPYQFPEKLMPLMILRAMTGQPLPVYGDGLHVRDWLYVVDHCAAVRCTLERGTPGETYNIGGRNEYTNLEIVRMLCTMLDELSPNSPVRPHAKLITFVQDRPGHDRRYAIDASKIARELFWRPCESFATGLRKTVQWYLQHQDWVENVTSGAYRDWMTKNYGTRDGL